MRSNDLHRLKVDFGKHARVVALGAADDRRAVHNGRRARACCGKRDAVDHADKPVVFDRRLHQFALARGEDHFAPATRHDARTNARAIGDRRVGKTRTRLEVDRPQRSRVRADDDNAVHDSGTAPVRADLFVHLPPERTRLGVHADHGRRSSRPIPVELGTGVHEIAVLRRHAVQALSRILQPGFNEPARGKRVGRHAHKVAARHRYGNHAVGVSHATRCVDGRRKLHRLFELARLRVIGAQYRVRRLARIRIGVPDRIAFGNVDQAVHDQQVRHVRVGTFSTQQALRPRKVGTRLHKGQASFRKTRRVASVGAPRHVV